MYICEHCGAIFDEPRLSTHYESRGEYWGFPAYEKMVYAYCPECGSEDINDYYPDDEDEYDDEWEDDVC